MFGYINYNIIFKMNNLNYDINFLVIDNFLKNNFFNR